MLCNHSLRLGVILLPALAFCQTHIPPGFISGTWTTALSPYILDGNVVLHADSTLVIEPGVTVLFPPDNRFRIEGQLLAIGTSQDSIIFTATDPGSGCESLDFLSTNSSPRDSSQLEFCVIRYGTASPAPDTYMHGGGLYIKNSSRLRVSHCLISYCRTRDIIGEDGANGTGGQNGGPGQTAITGWGGAIYCENSSPKFICCEISYNNTGNATGGAGGEGGYVYVSPEGSGSGGDGGTGGNGLAGQGGAIALFNSSPLFEGCIISHNSTGQGMGGAGGNGGDAYGYWGGPGYEIPHVYGGDGGVGGSGSGGDGGAFSADLESQSQIFNCLFSFNECGNGYGGLGGGGGEANGSFAVCVDGYGGAGGDGTGGSGFGIYKMAPNFPPLLSCTITQHFTPSSGQGGGGGTNGSGIGTGPWGTGTNGSKVLWGDNLAISNSIIWNNLAPIISNNATITYTCFEGGFAGQGNLNADPAFVNGPEGDCYLSQIAAGQPIQSPCVDAADPASIMLVGTTRIDGVLDQNVLDMGFHYNSLSAGLPILMVAPLTLHFAGAYSQTIPLAQTLVISNGGYFPFSYSISSNAAWLNLSAASGGPIPPTDSLIVSIDTTGILPGNYQAEILIIAPGAIYSPATIPVTLWMQETNISGALSGLMSSAAYLIVGDIYVPAESSLVIEPGTSFLFGGAYNFDIFGYLNANGTQEDSIKFIPDEGVSGWKGLCFRNSSSDSSLLNYCLIAHSDSTGIVCDSASPTIKHCTIAHNHFYPNYSLPHRGAGIFCISSGALIDSCSIIDNQATNPYPVGAGGISVAGSDSVRITHSLINANSGYSGGGIYIEGASCIIDDCIISENTLGGGIKGYYDFLEITNCLIENNQTTWDGGGICLYPQGGSMRYAVSNCTIRGNSAQNGAGLAVDDVISSSCEISQCEISANIASEKGGGLYLMHADSGNIHNCLIRGNEALYGGGVCIIESYAPGISKCTIQNNSASDGGGMYLSAAWFNPEHPDYLENFIIKDNLGGGVHFSNAIIPLEVRFSDLHDNQDGNFTGLNIPAGSGEIVATNLNGDSCDIYHNIFLDPLFVNPDSGNFHLTQNSPCIDAGDPESPLDPDSTIADMGVFYFPHVLGISDNSAALIPTECFLSPAFPNPFNPMTIIRFDLPKASWVKLEVFDITGRRVEVHSLAPSPSWHPAGVHEMSFNGSDLASGVYIVKLQAGEFSTMQKLILLK